MRIADGLGRARSEICGYYVFGGVTRVRRDTRRGQDRVGRRSEATTGSGDIAWVLRCVLLWARRLRGKGEDGCEVSLLQATCGEMGSARDSNRGSAGGHRQISLQASVKFRFKIRIKASDRGREVGQAAWARRASLFGVEPSLSLICRSLKVEATSCTLQRQARLPVRDTARVDHVYSLLYSVFRLFPDRRLLDWTGTGVSCTPHPISTFLKML
ncbi:hypothetical protein EJ04DRAFT_270415 [Polyplosphaeria fusca]|uniref:Uncharacterized protein n=1 Tax=Polyplosphaeria fusca TaxID=682080 RepID=A0A9P4QVJ7_9PLEO|nr:hypothetical protein EJ04DRAFT_270415 [Polyplosphaeria fusca]